MPADVLKLVESVLAEKTAVATKERELISNLNRVLPGIGYRVVPIGAQAEPKRRHRAAPGSSGPPGRQASFVPAVPAHVRPPASSGTPHERHARSTEGARGARPRTKATKKRS